MKSLIYAVVAIGLVSAFPPEMSPGPSKSHKPSRTPVLVELFTSEGCSSCPPADELLAKLQASQPVDGAEIIPLSEHVDYWDGASWRDPFSSAAFTSRQQAYVKALHIDGPYTPQMVIDGRTEFVGSDEGAALNSISAASGVRKAAVELSVGAPQASSVSVTISVKGLVAQGGGDTEDVFLAVTENNLSSHVRGGENGGRLLHHAAVVRSLQRVGPVTPGVVLSQSIDLKLAPTWKKLDLSIVAFVQSRRTGRIFGAGMSSLSKS